nr:hypothetical protein [Tanacetum cinerariifolium]
MWRSKVGFGFDLFVSVSRHGEISVDVLSLCSVEVVHVVSCYCNRWMSMMDVPNDAIKLMIFPYSLEDRARICEAWDHFKELLRACPHHGFSELTQKDTFYNGLTEQDQDSLNAASGGNLLNKTTREALQIMENKSKVRYSRSKSNVSRLNTNSRDNVSKTDDRIDKLTDQISNLVEIVNKQVVAPAKAVEKICVTCGGAHAYYECIATDSNPSSHQIPPPGFASVQNNSNRFNQGQGNFFNQANSFNPGNNFRGNNFQNNQVPNNQIPPSVPNEFSNYMKSNEIVIKSMQNHINVLRGDFSKQEENLRRNINDDMRNILSSFFQNQPSTSGTLPSNTIPNPKGEMKALTTCSGLAYEGPSIPTKFPLENVDEQNTEEILDKEQSNSSGSTAQVQPPVVPISIPEPDVSRTHFANALLLMPKFASTIKSLLANKDKLFELAKVSLNENFLAMLLKKLLENLGDPELTPTRMTLELADRSITRPKGVVEDVFVKVGKFHFLTDFVVVEFEADPRVPLILGRSFLRTGLALIDVYGEEITLRINDESITFNLNQTLKYSSTYDDTSRIGQSPVTKESLRTYLSRFLNDDSIPIGIENYVYDPEGDILFLEKLLNEDPFQIPLMDLKLVEESKEKSPVEEPPELEL